MRQLPKALSPDSPITLRDIVEAFAAQQRYASRQIEEIVAYHTLKLSLLVELFGCDLVVRDAELENEWNRLYHRSKADRANMQHMAVWFFRDCTAFLNQDQTPFDHPGLMEGSPPDLELALWDRFGERLMADRTRFNETVIELSIATLVALFPGIESKRHTWGELLERGLAALAPDPIDFY